MAASQTDIKTSNFSLPCYYLRKLEVLLKGMNLKDVNKIVNGAFLIAEYFTAAIFADNSAV